MICIYNVLSEIKWKVISKRKNENKIRSFQMITDLMLILKIKPIKR